MRRLGNRTGKRHLRLGDLTGGKFRRVAADVELVAAGFARGGVELFVTGALTDICVVSEKERRMY